MDMRFPLQTGLLVVLLTSLLGSLTARAETDDLCPNNGLDAVATIQNLIQTTHWDAEYFLWLSQGERFPKSDISFVRTQFETTAIEPLHETDPATLHRKTKYLRQTLLLKHPDLVLPTFASHFLMKKLQKEGFQVMNSSSIPTSLRPLACTFIRSYLVGQLRRTPLSVVHNWLDLDQMISKLMETSIEFKELAQGADEMAKMDSNALPEHFSHFISELYAWRKYLLESRIAPQGVISRWISYTTGKAKEPFVPLLSSAASERLNADQTQTPPPAINYSRELLSATIENELHETETLLGMPAVTEQDLVSLISTFSGPGAAARMSRLVTADVSLDHEELTRRFAFDAKLGQRYTFVEFRSDKRVFDLSRAFETMVYRDYNDDQGFDRNLKPRPRQIAYENRSYDIAFEALKGLKHPYVFGELTRMASFRWDRFPDWVVGMIRKQRNPKLIKAWIHPKEEAFSVLTNNLSTADESELEYIGAWASEQLREVALLRSREFQNRQLKSILDDFSKKYLLFSEAVRLTLELREKNGPTFGVAEQPQMDKIDFYTQNSAKKMAAHKIWNMPARAAWYTKDHAASMALTAGLLTLPALGEATATYWVTESTLWAMTALGRLTSGANTAMKFGLGLIAVRSGVEAGRVALGSANPQNLLGVTGILAGESIGSALDYFTMAAVPGVMSATSKLSDARTMATAYEELGLPVGTPLSAVREKIWTRIGSALSLSERYTPRDVTEEVGLLMNEATEGGQARAKLAAFSNLMRVYGRIRDTAPESLPRAFEILKVSPNASAAQIRFAFYRRLCDITGSRIGTSPNILMAQVQRIYSTMPGITERLPGTAISALDNVMWANARAQTGVIESRLLQIAQWMN